MPNNLKKYQPLPKIENRLYNQGQSSLSRLSSEVTTMAIKQEQSRENIPQAHRMHRKQRLKSEPLHDEDLKQTKNQLQKLRFMLQKRKMQRSLIIDDKLKRLSRLVAQPASNSLETPRSSVNYISMSPPSQAQPMYNMYPPPMPTMNPYMPMPMPTSPYIPYMLASPPYYPNYQSIDDRFERQREYERERDRDRRERDRYYYEQDRAISRKSSYSYNKRRPRDSREKMLRPPYKDERFSDDYEQPSRYKQFKETSKNRKFFKKGVKKLLKKWRAVVWAIMYALSLPEYSKKIANLRIESFKTFQKKKFNIELTMLQKYMVKKCKPFFVYIANQKQFDLTMEPGQTERMDNEKAIIAKKMVGFLIEGLNSINVNDTNDPATNPIEIIHMFCKHGGFVTPFMTEEQLDMVEVSDKKYLRLDRNMQMSQIINFICNKILLYNTILHPFKVDAKLFPEDNEAIIKNFHFFGSIWYELCLEVQDEYLCQVPPEYKLGNWRKIRQKVGIMPARSLTVGGKQRQAEQMVSGLLGKKNIDQIFGVNFWRKQKNILKSAIESVHQTIVKYHQRLKSKVKF